MIYTKPITIDANTSESSPREDFINISTGVIHKVEVLFPPGCAGLVGVRIHQGGHQIYPTDTEAFISDAETISFNDYHIVQRGYTSLRILSYNTDTLYAHTIYLRFGVLKEWQINPQQALNRVSNTIEVLTHAISGFMDKLIQKEEGEENGEMEI